MDTPEISWINTALGYLLMLLPLSVFWFYQTGLVKDTLIALGRMTAQLLIIGLYLEFLFSLESMWVNIVWIMIMVLVANYTISQRSEIKMQYFFWPIFWAVIISLAIVDAFFLGVAIRLDNVFETRYLIPITGMILGNCLRTNIIALNTFYHSLSREKGRYHYFLSCGASQSEALAPFMRDALKTAFNPAIATMAIVGIISLPGAMTGQIISGTDPMLAIRYQLLFMITIFVASNLTVLLSILLANRVTFDPFQRLKKDVVRK